LNLFGKKFLLFSNLLRIRIIVSIKAFLSNVISHWWRNNSHNWYKHENWKHYDKCKHFNFLIKKGRRCKTPLAKFFNDYLKQELIQKNEPDFPMLQTMLLYYFFFHFTNDDDILMLSIL